MKRRLPRSHKSVATITIIAIALVLISVFMYVRFFKPPNKDDFEQAKVQAATLKSVTTQADQVTAKHVQAVVASLRLDPTGKKLKDDTAQSQKEYDKALDRYVDASRDLQASPAARDDQVGKVVDRVAEQSDRFTSSFSALTQMYPAFYKTYISCDDVNRFTAGSDSAQNAKNFNARSDDCIRDLAELARSSRVKSIAQYAVERGKVVREQRSAYDSLAKQDANRSILTTRLAELDRKADMLDPVAKLQQERATAIDTSAIDELVKQLDNKINT